MLHRIRRAAPVLIAYSLLLSAGLFARGYVVPVVVSGGSMRPALVPGDIVLVLPRTAPAVGDIALIHSGQSLVLHRVTRTLRDGSLETRGDANPIGDLRPASPRDIRGRVAAADQGRARATGRAARSSSEKRFTPPAAT